jgi:hypothetical protein
MKKFVTAVLQYRCGRWRCVLLLDQFEFFAIFHRSYVVHLAQFVELAQSQASFTQISQGGLAVVLAGILQARLFSAVYFVQYHDVFIMEELHQRHPLRAVLLCRAVVRLWAVWLRVVQDRARFRLRLNPVRW